MSRDACKPRGKPRSSWQKNEFNLRQELSDVKPLERKALTKRNRKKSSSETVLVELGSRSEIISVLQFVT